MLKNRITQTKTTVLDSKGRDVDEDNDGLDLFVLAVKTGGEFEERAVAETICQRSKKIPETI